MKNWTSLLLTPTLFGVDIEFERKVPPRRPDQRLATLKKFALDWSDRFIGPNCTVCERAHPRHYVFEQKVNVQYDRFVRAYSRPTCRYYNPDLPHGGPNPNPKIRNRREEQILLGDDDMDIFDSDLMRVSSNPMYALRQIFVGFRKWTERYIAECHGERVHHYHTKRLKVFNLRQIQSDTLKQ